MIYTLSKIICPYDHVLKTVGEEEVPEMGGIKIIIKLKKNAITLNILNI